MKDVSIRKYIIDNFKGDNEREIPEDAKEERAFNERPAGPRAAVLKY